MKFACERCGKRYASVDEPAAGRVYRIRCRCGHVIVVRGAAAAPRGPDVRRFAPAPLPPPLATPEVEEPSRAEAPARRAPAPEEEASVEALQHAASEAPSPAPVTAPRTPVEEPAPAIEDDPFLGAVAGAKREAMRPAEISDGEGWRAGPPRDERGDPLAADPGGAAALPVALPLGLGEDGASARRHVLLAAVLALLAVAAALAVWSM